MDIDNPGGNEDFPQLNEQDIEIDPDETVEETDAPEGEDPPEDETEEPPEEGEPEEDEPWEGSEKELLSELGVDEVETVKDLVAKFKELKDRPVERPPEQAAPTAAPPAQDTVKQPAYDKTTFSKTVDSFLQNMPAADEATKQSWKAIGNVLDQGFAPVAERMEQERAVVMGSFGKVIDYLRKDSWSRCPNEYKKHVGQKELDAIMDSKGYLDYREAFLDYARSKPELWTVFSKENEKRGIEKGKKLRLRRSTAVRRGAPPSKSGGGEIWRKYLSGPPGSLLDETKLNRVNGSEKQAEIAEAYEKWLVKQSRR